MNEAGESEPSEVNAGSNSIKMLDIPRTITKPNSYAKDATGFTLAWTRLGIDDTVKVYCGADSEEPTQLAVDSWSTTQLSQTRRVNFVPGTRKYSCYIRACNDCGCSNASETEVVTLTDVPEAPQVVVYKPTACSIRCDW